VLKIPGRLNPLCHLWLVLAIASQRRAAWLQVVPVCERADRDTPSVTRAERLPLPVRQIRT
jgi:hypothetical protein